MSIEIILLISLTVSAHGPSSRHRHLAESGISKIVFKDTKHRTKIMEDKHLSRK